MMLAVPWLAEAVDREHRRLLPSVPGPVPLVHESELPSLPVLHPLLMDHLAALRKDRGWSFDAAADEVDVLAMQGYLTLNFLLQGRKAFWVDGELADLLRETTLDITGEVLKLPFPACAFVFDDPKTLEIAQAVVSFHPHAELRDARLKVLTVYALELPPEAGEPGIRLIFASDDMSGRRPHVATRDIVTVGARDLDAILDSHPEGPVDPFFRSAALRALSHLAINAILYTTCSDFRFYERHSPLGVAGAHRFDRTERRAFERAGLSGETVFYLPGRIRIAGGPLGDSEGKGERGTSKLTKRFWVRGHWRRPAPGWKETRIRWIEPYLKGPEMTAVIEREYELRK